MLEFVVMAIKKNDNNDDVRSNPDQTAKNDEDVFKTSEFPPEFFRTPEFDEEFFKTPEFPPDFFKTSPAEPLPPTDTNLTASDVAEWMESQVMKSDYLARDHAAYYIQGHFGDRFTFININGNLAIAREVLAEFYQRTKDTIVWCKSERYGRKRQPQDEPSREQKC